MGFDNDCIINIQSLAGEYFCPVCRLLVYPNEAIQSQCTHLYCKPCLTYVVSTTRACPYDGYLVTEADSKPLTESNKALAETIGKISVHCLFHRSGCTWRGPLSECTSHCSGCAFGNSPVVCNRCGIQIVHRQVQEHAQSCLGVQVQMQQTDSVQDNAATARASAGQAQATNAPVGTSTSESQSSQTTDITVQDPGQQATATSQGQAVVQAAVSTHEQWYQQQQQQYQQYYQQYPGYEQYQQHYQQCYPYQQQFGQYHQQHQQAHIAQAGQPLPHMQPHLQSQASAQPQLQLQAQSQPQPHLQSSLPVPAHVASQSLSQTPVNQQQLPHPAVQPHSQIQSQSQSLTQGHPNSQSQTQPYPQGQPSSVPLPVQHLQMPQYQQPSPQIQHTQHAVHSASQPQHNPLPHLQPPLQGQAQPQPHIQPQTQHLSSHGVTGFQSFPQMQPQPHFHQQLQIATPHQHPALAHPQGPQQQTQFPQPTQVRPLQSNASVSQQQQASLPSHGQTSTSIPTQLQTNQPPQVQQSGHNIQQHPTMAPVAQSTPSVQQSFGGQLSVQQQNLMVQQPTQSQIWPQRPSHAFQQTQPYTHPQQNVSLPHGAQLHQSQNIGARLLMPKHVQSQPYLQSAAGSADSVNASLLQPGPNKPFGLEPDDVKAAKFKSDLQSASNNSKPMGEVKDKSTHANTSGKDIPGSDSLQKVNGEPLEVQLAKEEAGGSSKAGEVAADGQINFAKDGANLEKQLVVSNKEIRDEKSHNLQKGMSGHQELNQSQMLGHGQMQAGSVMHSARSVQGADRGVNQPSTHFGAPALQQRSTAPSTLQSSSGPQHNQLPGYAPNQSRPQDVGHSRNPGQQPHGPKIPSGPGSSLFSKGPSHLGHQPAPLGPYNQGHLNAPHAQLHGLGSVDGRRPDLPHPGSSDNVPFGPPSHVHPTMSQMNAPSALDTLHGDRLKHFPDENKNPVHADLVRRGFEDDLKHFPRPSHLSAEPVPRYGHSYGGPSPGAALPPYHHGPSEAGERLGLLDDTFGTLDPSRARPDLRGPISGHDRHLMDGWLPRSPSRGYPGISSGFGGGPGGPHFGMQDVDAKESHQFDNPVGNLFHESRFPSLPGHLRTTEFDVPGNMRMGGRYRGEDFIRQNALSRGKFLDSHNLSSGLQSGDHAGVRDFLGSATFRTFPSCPRPPGEFFEANWPNHMKLGEPGFRSSFVLQGDMDPFVNSRKRKPVSMGWCRICKVDCETVEGLEIHSQTSQHQKMTMDMVRSIKQNAKKHKMTPNNHFSLGDAGRPRNAKSEGHKSKN